MSIGAMLRGPRLMAGWGKAWEQMGGQVQYSPDCIPKQPVTLRRGGRAQVGMPGGLTRHSTLLTLPQFTDGFKAGPDFPVVQTDATEATLCWNLFI